MMIQYSSTISILVGLVSGLILIILAILPAGPVLGVGALATASLAFIVGFTLTVISGIALAIRFLRHK